MNLSEQTRKVLKTLTPREEKVLRMPFGIGVKSDRTLEAVSQDFEVTGERIRPIEARALRTRDNARSQATKQLVGVLNRQLVRGSSAQIVQVALYGCTHAHQGAQARRALSTSIRTSVRHRSSAGALLEILAPRSERVLNVSDEHAPMARTAFAVCAVRWLLSDRYTTTGT